MAKLPGGVGRFLPCGIGSHMSRLGHLGWNQCSHGLTSRPKESCHHRCLKAVCGVLGYPKGSASELLDGTLKLRHCTTIFTMRLPLWSLPGIGNAVGETKNFPCGHLLNESSNTGKRVRLARKTRPGVLVLRYLDPGHPTPRRWKRLHPLTPQEQGVGGCAPQSFFLGLGLGEVCGGNAWNLPSEGTGVGGSGWSVRPKRSVHRHLPILISCR